jgi:hypothetical protein
MTKTELPCVEDCDAVSVALNCAVRDHSYQYRSVDGQRHLVFYCEDESGPTITYDSMRALADHFGTTKIDIGDFSKTDGCETCDYGSTMCCTVRVCVERG